MQPQPISNTSILTVISPKHGVFRLFIDSEDVPRVRGLRLSPQVHPHGRVYFRAETRTEDGKRKCVLLHRLITDAPRHLEVDHIRHDYCDLRKSQLALVTRKQNQENTRHNRDRRYPRGVSKGTPGKVQASIKHYGKSRHLGVYPATPEGIRQAARAYDRKALELFTRPLLNFPMSDYIEVAA
jgi:hypothetical protein